MASWLGRGHPSVTMALCLLCLWPVLCPWATHKAIHAVSRGQEPLLEEASPLVLGACGCNNALLHLRHTCSQRMPCYKERQTIEALESMETPGCQLPDRFHYGAFLRYTRFPIGIGTRIYPPIVRHRKQQDKSNFKGVNAADTQDTTCRGVSRTGRKACT